MEKCIFCALASGKIPSLKIYEDDEFFSCLDINPATPGHVILFPKKHYKTFMEMNDNEMKDLSFVIRGLSLALLEFGAEGVDIFYPIGAAAGQKSAHMVIHLIPRYKDDGLKFEWEPRKISKEDMLEIQKKIASFVKIMRKKEKVVEEKKPEEVKQKMPPRHGGYGL